MRCRQTLSDNCPSADHRRPETAGGRVERKRSASVPRAREERVRADRRGSEAPPPRGLSSDRQLRSRPKAYPPSRLPDLERCPLSPAETGRRQGEFSRPGCPDGSWRSGSGPESTISAEPKARRLFWEHPRMAPEPLPIGPLLPRVTDLLRDRGALVFCAPPGAGKTTRVPPAILRAGLADRLVPQPVEPVDKAVGVIGSGPRTEPPSGDRGFRMVFEHVASLLLKDAECAEYRRVPLMRQAAESAAGRTSDLEPPDPLFPTGETGEGLPAAEGSDRRTGGSVAPNAAPVAGSRPGAPKEAASTENGSSVGGRERGP
jgi:hypothetical protein